MSRDEVKIAEAIASLTARLDSWGIEDAATKAHAYVTDMLRQGWRPRALAVEVQPVRVSGRSAPPSDALAEARRQIAAAQAAHHTAVAATRAEPSAVPDEEDE